MPPIENIQAAEPKHTKFGEARTKSRGRFDRPILTFPRRHKLERFQRHSV